MPEDLLLREVLLVTRRAPALRRRPWFPFPLGIAIGQLRNEFCQIDNTVFEENLAVREVSLDQQPVFQGGMRAGVQAAWTPARSRRADLISASF